MAIYVSISVIVVLLLLAMYYYNQLVRKRNQIENSISSTDALFIKRSDLIPNLISTVQKHMTFEKETLKQIIMLRQMRSNVNPKEEAQAKQALDNLMIQVERYPELKSSDQFRDLQYSLNEVEEQISAGRRYISASITNYNNTIGMFPSNIIAGISGFKKYEWQYASETQRENVNVKDLFNN